MQRSLDYIGKLLSSFEDERYPSVGPHLRILNLIGLWHPNKSKMAQFKLYILYTAVVFFGSQYVKCLIKFDTASLLLILQYAPFHMGVMKGCFFQKDYNKWENFIMYMSSLERDQLSKENEQHDEITQYIKRERRVSYFYWTMAFFSNFSIFSEPYRQNQKYGNETYTKLFDGYVPYGDVPPGYYVSMFIQTCLGNMATAYVVSWDTLVITVMIFLAGQLRIAGINCKKMIKYDDDNETRKNIIYCHGHHTTLVKYQQMFNRMISPIMFIYLVVICVNLGVCIINIAQLQNDLAALLSSCVYLMACLIQLLLFYWHANEVTEESMLVSYNTFKSSWPGSSTKVQKEAALLGLSTGKKIVFTAGPFNEMSLTTFIAILRASYTFYTLLNKT